MHPQSKLDSVDAFNLKGFSRQVGTVKSHVNSLRLAPVAQDVAIEHPVVAARHCTEEGHLAPRGKISVSPFGVVGRVGGVLISLAAFFQSN